MPRERVAPTAHQGRLFDHLMAEHNIKNDAQLSRELQIAPPYLSKMRNGLLGVGPTTILAVHERFGMPVKAIREQLA